MIFTLKEIIRWFGVTIFEIVIILAGILIYSILLTLKLDGVLQDSSWWSIHTPLFIADALSAYFCVIVFIRQYLEGTYKLAVFRAIWSFIQLLLLLLAKLLLCFKLDGKSMTHSEVLSPIFFLLVLLAIRACHLH